MATIEHIAIRAHDNVALAEFYKSVFGMQEVHRSDYTDHDRTAVFLTDGTINVAFLPVWEGQREGIDHFGFRVEDAQGTLDAALAAGARPGPSVPKDGRFNEAKVFDLAGAQIDLSSRGWATAPLGADEAAAIAFRKTT